MVAEQMKIDIWNANGLEQHQSDIPLSIKHNAYIRNTFHKSNFTLHNSVPDGTAQGETAVFIKSSINHQGIKQNQKAHIQATRVSIELNN